MRTLMTIFLAMICISVGFLANAQAQSIFISVDGINPEADTLNFGARTENNPKVDSFFVVNNSSDTLLIPFDPFYLNRVNAIPFDNTFAEFELDTIQQRSRPFIILPGSRFSIKINFKVDTADKGAGFESDGLLKRGRIFINLCKYGDTNDIKASDTIHLQGDRTARFMKPSESIMVFDTMYIGTTKKDTLIVYNGTSSKTLDVNITTKNIPNVKINPIDLGGKIIPPDSAYRIPIEYTVNSLSDTLIRDVLTITSSPGAKSQEETSSIDIKSFVAFQKFEIDSINTVNFDPIAKIQVVNSRSILLLDTISIDSSSIIYNISMRNTGNLQLNIDSVVLSGDASAGFEFNFTNLSRNLAVDRPTSFEVKFSPKMQSGIWKATVSFYTDLKKRFPNEKLEKSVEVSKITITGIAKAAKPELISLQDTCAIIYTSKNGGLECNPGCTRALILQNKGDVELKVDSVLFKDESELFITENRKTVIGPGKTDTLLVKLKPTNQEGTFTNTLLVYTNTGNFTREITFTSVFPTAKIIIDEVEASPGDTITIPIKVESDQLFRAQYFLADFIIPCESRKALEFLGLELNESAAEKATPTRSTSLVPSNVNGVSNQLLSFGFNPTGSFEQFDSTKNTLGYLKFKYFLNESFYSEIKIEKYKLGYGYNDDTGPVFCDDLFEITFPSKIIIKAKENSFCADQETLNSLFSDIRDTNNCKFLALIPVSGSVLEIQHFMPEPMHADISLYAVTGEKVETIFSGIAPKDLTKFQHPLSHLTKGVYYCEMKTGTFRKTIPIIVSQ